MAQVISDHFWACWWLVIAILVTIHDTVCNWQNGKIQTERAKHTKGEK